MERLNSDETNAFRKKGASITRIKCKIIIIMFNSK